MGLFISKKMLIYDSHCHMEHILQLKVHNTPMLVPCTKLEDINQLSILRTKHNNYKIGLGVHPWFVDSVTNNMEELLIQYQPDFVGEIGLDYLHDNVLLQHETFKMQLLVAKHYNLPVIIHCVRAYNQVLSLVKLCRITHGIIHAFNANDIVAKQFIKQGFILGIGSLITKNTLINKHLAKIPLEYLILESDAPFMRAKDRDVSNSSDTLLYAKLMANIYQTDLDKIINQSNLNFNRIIFS